MFDPYLLTALFFLVALVYASAGFGGGSSYLALLLLAGMSTGEVKAIALVCNILVVSGSMINFVRKGWFRAAEMLPLVIFSVPFAFVGGLIQVSRETFLLVAAIALIVASVLMILRSGWQDQVYELSHKQLGGIGAAIGFLSGFIGIGGGIFLSPFLHLSRTMEVKKIAVATTFFILVNSLAGLAGLATSFPLIDGYLLLSLGLAVLIGGQLGNRLNMRVFKPNWIRSVSAILIGFVGVRLLFQHFLT